MQIWMHPLCLEGEGKQTIHMQHRLCGGFLVGMLCCCCGLKRFVYFFIFLPTSCWGWHQLGVADQYLWLVKCWLLWLRLVQILRTWKEEGKDRSLKEIWKWEVQKNHASNWNIVLNHPLPPKTNPEYVN